ncbi:MAG: tyrosine recombinase XerC [Gammaproteobacteria bacterium]|nr:tyrosine recombinase XerC [Gammaproteobacteria bacterium]
MPSDLQQDMQQFLQVLSVERRYSSYTINAYQHDISDFLRFCQRASLSSWKRVGQAEVQRYISISHQRGLSGRSLERRLSALRSLFKFLLREELMVHNPAVMVHAPSGEYTLPVIPDVAQVQALLESMLTGRLGSRDRAMMELFYSSGLRLMELTSLNITDLDQPDGSVRVRGKGSKDRIVPVGEKAWLALRSWFVARESMANADETALFVSQRGTRISVRAIQSRLRYWSERLQWHHALHPHMLRHAFASHILQSSGDLRGVQELLGHADIATTQIYTHLEFQHLNEVYQRAHPRARKKGSES